MGVISRRVLPACGSLCFFCPSLRARSRQPVKRYKKLLANCFPRSQDGDPNERMVSKLCDYATKNPMRLPKITEYLEQRLEKELLNERLAFARVVPFIYRKFLTSCKEQMPLYSLSVLGTIRTLLDQSRHNDMRILGCQTLIDFLNNQTDNTYILNIEGQVPKLCQLACEVGDDDGMCSVRSSALQALASVLLFMGEHSHLSEYIDDILSATLQNYQVQEVDPNKNNQDAPCSKLHSHENEVLQLPVNLESLTPQIDAKIKPETFVDFHGNPSHWAKLCLHNMAALAKEVTTVRRVVEPFFHYFDTGNHWSSDEGLACSVLCEMGGVMESGQNTHLLLSLVLKHLDHRDVSGKPSLQVKIVNVSRYLAKKVKIQASKAIIAAISDVLRHLRKCMILSLESSNSESGSCEWNTALLSALDDLLVLLINKVGDVGHVLDAMAIFLESIPVAVDASRITMATVYRAALIIASVPDRSYHDKEFPEALLHQLLLAMAHSDLGTRVASHRILLAVLVPSLIDTSEFSTSTIILEKLRQEHSSVTLDNEGDYLLDDISHVLQSSLEEKILCHLGKEGTLRLSSHQVDLLLSSAWLQAMSQKNCSSSYEALAHTYCLSLLFAQRNTSNYAVLVRCYQLAFSLRNLSENGDCSLHPSHRKSLSTLASCMLLFSERALRTGILSSSTKEASDEGMINDGDAAVYGFEGDNVSPALKSSYLVNRDEEHLKQMLKYHLMKRFEKLTEEDLSSISMQLSQPFSVEDSMPFRPPLSNAEIPDDGTPLKKILPVATLEDEDTLTNARNSKGSKIPEPMKSDTILGADQLLISVLETAQEVASLSAPLNPLPYDEMKNRCEALVAGKQQKMSSLLTFPRKSLDSLAEENLLTLTIPQRVGGPLEADGKLEFSDGYSSFRLPPSSPYDKFLRAAGVAQHNGVRSDC